MHSLLNLFRGKHFLNFTECPDMAKGIAEPAVSVSPEHIGGRHGRTAAFLYSPLVGRVHIGDANLEYASGAI